MVDAGHIEQQLAAQYEAVKQVALADLLVVSKGDLVDGEQLARVEAQLAALNPAAPIQQVTNGELSPAVLEKLGAYNEAAGRDVRQLQAWLRTESPKQGLASPMQPKMQPFAAKVGTAAPTHFEHGNIVSVSRSSPPACWPPSMRCRPNMAMPCCVSRGSCSWRARASRW